MLPGLLSAILFCSMDILAYSPVCRVKCNGVHLDKNAVLKQFGLSNILNFGLAGGHDLDGLHV